MNAPAPPSGPRVLHPLEEAAARRAAALALARSRRSLRWLCPADDRYLAAFSEIDPALVHAAFEDGRPVGVLALRRGLRDPVRLGPRRAVAVWGPLLGPPRWAGYHLMQALVSGRGLHVAAFWVAPDRRGRGVGSALLASLTRDADAAITVQARPNAAPLFARHGWRPRARPRARIAARLAGTVAMTRPAGRAGT